MKSYSDNQTGFSKRYLRITLVTIGILITGFLAFSLTPIGINSQFLLTTILFLFILGLLWFGNTAINRFLDKMTPWLTYGAARFFAQLALILIYSLIVINISYYSFKTLFTIDPPTTNQILVMNVYGGISIIVVTSIYFGISFLRSWKKSEAEGERMQKEHIKAQLKALQSHLDPHFLFNNLNILSSLIDKDVAQSKLFLDHFAEVYRGLLRKDLEDIIPLKEEIEFLETYLYLVKIRFEEYITVEIDIPDELMKCYIPPLSLQMLVENAIKHNKITETIPLVISLFANDNKEGLEIRNSLNKKASNNEGGSGLENISKRYSYFTHEKVRFFEKDGQFIVNVPLLQVEQL